MSDLDDDKIKATRKLLGLDKVIDINVGDIQKNINNLKVYLKYDNIYQKYKIDKNTKKLSDFDIFCIEHCIDIDNLINEYERQKQINEEHQKTNRELREKVKELKKENHIQKKQIMNIFDNEYITKQKIKNKIEKILNVKIHNYNYLADTDWNYTQEQMDRQIAKLLKIILDEVLEELLQEEDK